MAELRTLRIGVDGRELTGQATGVGRYIRGVLRAWTEMPIRHRVLVFVPELPQSELMAELGSSIEWITTGAGARPITWEQWHLPKAAAAAGVDVFFAGAYTAPLRLHCPFVLVVHDVSYFAHPEWFAPRERWRRQVLTRYSVRRAARVLTVSAFSASELQRYLGVPADRIALAPGGAPAAQPSAPAGSEPVVLYVGSLFNRRLIPELLGGFAEATRTIPTARLVMVGDNRTYPRIDPLQVAQSLGVTGRVAWHTWVSDVELDRLYTSARVFAFLSTYEGFALTPLEAIARGVPPVLLDTPVAREIYDGAALLVPPDPPAIGKAICTLLSDGPVRDAVVARGAELLSRYTWTATAVTILDELERAAGRHR
ncbi:MAG: glycosyltransferase family 1 protein [Acidobacteriota bacterium]|nr:MAG: hypothetical protein DIU54_05690 [Acidobacteriota bacterium]